MRERRHEMKKAYSKKREKTGARNEMRGKNGRKRNEKEEYDK